LDAHANRLGLELNCVGWNLKRLAKAAAVSGRQTCFTLKMSVTAKPKDKSDN
jgi:hypothetical protein